MTKTTEFTFWMDARKYTTLKPRLTGGEIRTLADAPSQYLLYREQSGGDVHIGDGVATDMKGIPHFYCVPPATSHRGIQ